MNVRPKKLTLPRRRHATRRAPKWHADFAALQTATGAILQQWAHFERQLDNWITLIFRDYEGKALADRGLVPGGYSRKVEFLYRAFRKRIRLRAHNAEFESIMKAAAPMVEMRNSLVHGSLYSHKAYRGAFTFVRLDLGEGEYTINRYRLNLRRFPDLFDRLVTLASRSARLSAALLREANKGQ